MSVIAAAPAARPTRKKPMLRGASGSGIDVSLDRRDQLPDRRAALTLQSVLPPQIDRTIDEMIERDGHRKRQHQREIHACEGVGLQHPAEEIMADVERIGELADIFVELEIPGHLEQPGHAERDGGKQRERGETLDTVPAVDRKADEQGGGSGCEQELRLVSLRFIPSSTDIVAKRSRQEQRDLGRKEAE